jgi:hypothetical protein
MQQAPKMIHAYDNPTICIPMHISHKQTTIQTHHYFFIGKLHTQPMGSEPTTSPFTLMGEGNAIELELIGIARIRV